MPAKSLKFKCPVTGEQITIEISAPERGKSAKFKLRWTESTSAGVYTYLTKTQLEKLKALLAEPLPPPLKPGFYVLHPDESPLYVGTALKKIYKEGDMLHAKGSGGADEDFYFKEDGYYLAYVDADGTEFKLSS